jgi:hypothetical protein
MDLDVPCNTCSALTHDPPLCRKCRDQVAAGAAGDEEQVDGFDGNDGSLIRAATDATSAVTPARADSDAMSGNVLLTVGGLAVVPPHQEVPQLPLAEDARTVASAAEQEEARIRKWSPKGTKKTFFMGTAVVAKDIFSTGEIMAELDDPSRFLGSETIQFANKVTVHRGGHQLTFMVGHVLPTQPVRDVAAGTVIFGIAVTTAGVVMLAGNKPETGAFYWPTQFLDPSFPYENVDRAVMIVWAKIFGQLLTKQAADIGAAKNAAAARRGQPVQQTDDRRISSNASPAAPKDARAAESALAKSLQERIRSLEGQVKDGQSALSKSNRDHNTALKQKEDRYAELAAEHAQLQREIGVFEGAARQAELTRTRDARRAEFTVSSDSPMRHILKRKQGRKVRKELKSASGSSAKKRVAVSPSSRRAPPPRSTRAPSPSSPSVSSLSAISSVVSESEPSSSSAHVPKKRKERRAKSPAAPPVPASKKAKKAKKVEVEEVKAEKKDKKSKKDKKH